VILARRSKRAPASLGGEIVRAATWSSFGSIALRLGNFAVGVLAARLIAPDQFGVFAVALTVQMVLVNVSDLGVSAYVVRYDGDLDAVGPTVTTLAMVSAALLALAMALAAPWLSTELGSHAATGSVQILSLTVLLAGVSSVPGALLTREFRQDKRFLADSANFIASTAILVSLAPLGFGVIALAWSRVAGQGVSTLCLFKASPARYMPGLDRTVAAAVVAFGLPLIGSSFLGFLIGNIDYIVVGRVLGAKELGFYYLAYNVGSWPYVILSPIVVSVTVAAFSRVRHDRARLKERVGTSLAALVGVGFPANALIAALAGPLILVFYGPRWSSAAPALAFTAVYGGLRLPADLFSNIAIAEGRTRAMLMYQVAYLAGLAPLTIVCVHVWGIVGAGIAHVIAIAAVLLPGMVLTVARPTGFGFRALFATIARPLVASTAAALCGYFASRQVGAAWPALFVGGAAGVLLYVVLVASWGRKVAVAARRLWSGEHSDRVVSERVELVVRPEAARA
jgi:O-antigen/teichoic acid export membrane protein